MEKFTLINKDRSRIKVFEPFEDVSKPIPSIDAMMISYGCVYKYIKGVVNQLWRVQELKLSKQLGKNTNNYWMRDGRKQVSSGVISCYK